MNVAILNDDWPPRGKSSVVTIAENLARGFEARDHRVSIITTHRSEESSEIIREGNVISLPISYHIALRQYKCLRQPMVSRMVTSAFEELQPDVVHAHNLHTYLTYDALRVAQKRTPRVFITMHDAMSFAYARLATKRYLSSGGRSTQTTLLDHLRAVGLQWNPLRNVRIRTIIGRNVRRVIAPSRAIARALERHGIANAVVIPNGIDLSEWQCSEDDLTAFRSRHALKGRRVILFGGRLSIDKGAVQLLHALERVAETLPDVLLFVAGDPARWNGLVQEARIPETLKAHIANPGWLARGEMKLANFAASVAVVPSICLDVFPSAAIEAMAAGTPVVGTCFGGTPEIVRDGITGVICNPLDEFALASALQTLLTDKPLRERYGKAGRERIENDFTLEKQVERHLGLYGE